MIFSSERHTVQIPFLRYAEEAGWTYLSPEEALLRRRGESSPFLQSELIERLQALNPGVITSATKAEEVIERLCRVPPNIEGNLEAWEYLKGLKTVFVEAERREKNIRLLDPDHPEANVFHVTDEFRFAVGPVAIRADIVLLINGIPVILVETKSATRLEGIAEAFDQIRRYHEQAPEPLLRPQAGRRPYEGNLQWVGALENGVLQGAPWRIPTLLTSQHWKTGSGRLPVPSADRWMRPNSRIIFFH